ncbi:10039_t:CDS:2, partial [Acaulospora colombiana]
NATDENWQRTVLEWSQSFEKQITYDYAIILDVHSVINLEKIRQALDFSIINGQLLTAEQKSNLVWGLFDVQGSDEMLIVLSQKAISKILSQEEKTNVNLITQAYNYSSESSLYFVNDYIGIIEWSNAIENIPIETTIAIGNIYQEEEVEDLVAHLNLPNMKICHPPTRKNGPSIAIVTSSYIYENLCMLPVAINTAENKRNYALKNGYAFVGRSSEFAQQRYKKRKAVW